MKLVTSVIPKPARIRHLFGHRDVMAFAAVLVLLATSCASGGNVAVVATSSPSAAATTAAATASSAPVTTVPATARGGPSSVWCGTVVVNSITTGQGSAPNSFQLASPTGVLNARFIWQDGASALGTYVCVRLRGGVPMSGFDGVVSADLPDYVPQAVASTDSCGSVTRYAADGAQMLISLLAGGVTTQYFLEYQFAGDIAPNDIGNQLSANIPQILLITGRQVPPAAGAPGAINLHEYNVARVTSCTPLNRVIPQPTGFVLPLGCAFIDQPEVGVDQTRWKFDCGWASNNARGSLAPALKAQGWTCGIAVTATATWAKGTSRLVIVEGAGGFNGYPQLAQLRVGIQTGCP